MRDSAGQMIAGLASININPDSSRMRTLPPRTAMLAIACRTVAFWLGGAILPLAAFGQIHAQSVRDIEVEDHRGDVLFRLPNDFGDGMREQVEPTGPTTFGFVPGHYYSSNYSSRVIKEYNGAGIAIASYTLPSALGEEVRGLAFGSDGLLYATVSRGSSGCAVLALRSDGTVAASYTWPVDVTGSNLMYGRIAMDNQYLYLCGAGGLTRFLLGDPSSGTSIYSGNSIYDVKPLPNGHLFVAFSGNIDEITTTGALVRHVTPYPFSILVDVCGIEYNPATNILFCNASGAH